VDGVVAEESKGQSLLNYELSENLFIKKPLSKNANTGAENTHFKEFKGTIGILSTLSKIWNVCRKISAPQIQLADFARFKSYKFLYYYYYYIIDCDFLLCLLF